MSMLTEPGLRALRLMALRPDGKIDMHRGRMEAATPTINRLDNAGYAEWCDAEGYEPQMARITPAGRAALKEHDND